MQLHRQPRSGLATVKRDFSSNTMTDSSPFPVPTVATTKRSTLSDSLRKAIQDGVASREAEKAPLTPTSLTASQECSHSHGAAPPAKKRRLPSSWGECESSSTTLHNESSVSSTFFRSRSSTRSLPLDFLSEGHQPESPSDPSSQPKPARRPATISLSDEQKAVLDLVMQRQNVFYTGSAGMFRLGSYTLFVNAISVRVISLYVVPRITDSCLRALSSSIATAAYSPLRFILVERRLTCV
jgi:hypothetical protein